MGWLENRVPPVVWFLLSGFAGWIVSRAEVDVISFEGDVTDLLALVLAVIGSAFGAAGVVEFLRARTTVNPHSIDRASSLVTGGVYRVTRNPMYLGLLFLLVAWCLTLGSALALVVAVASFVAVITRLQIRPEERVLEERFGDAFRVYREQVRRWL